MVLFGLGHCLGEILDRIPQGRQLVPSSSTIGSSKRVDQPLLAIGFKALGQPRRLVLVRRIALRAGRAGCATGAGVRTFPWLILVGLAHPAAVLAK